MHRAVFLLSGLSSSIFDSNSFLNSLSLLTFLVVTILGFPSSLGGTNGSGGWCWWWFGGGCLFWMVALWGTCGCCKCGVGAAGIVAGCEVGAAGVGWLLVDVVVVVGGWSGCGRCGCRS